MNTAPSAARHRRRFHAAADVVVEGEWRTGLHEQMYLETQGMSAVSRADGSVEVLGSMQCPFYVHGAVQKVLGLRAEQVINYVKHRRRIWRQRGLPLYFWAAMRRFLAWKSAHPVKIIYDRSRISSVPPNATHLKAATKWG